MNKKVKSPVFCSEPCGDNNCLEMQIGTAILNSNILRTYLPKNMETPVEIHELFGNIVDAVFERDFPKISDERGTFLKNINASPDDLIRISIGSKSDEITPYEAVCALCMIEDLNLSQNLLKIVSESTDEDAVFAATRTIMKPFVVDLSKSTAIVFLGVRMRT